MAQTREFTPPRFSPMRVRVLSGLALGALAAATLGPLLLPIDGGGGVMTITRGLGWMLAAMVAMGSPGWRYVAPGELDERERGERERAVVIGHRVSGIAICLSYMWLLLASRGTLWVPDHVQAAWLMAMLFWVHVMLPGMILAWRAPADEED
jgi:hypothetical protein